MESHGIPGRIHVTEAVYERLGERVSFEPRGEIEVKGKGRIATWLVVAGGDPQSVAVEFSSVRPGTADRRHLEGRDQA